MCNNDSFIAGPLGQVGKRLHENSFAVNQRLAKCEFLAEKSHILGELHAAEIGQLNCLAI